MYGGLAGLFIVSDEEEKAAGLPFGEYDIPLIIQDRAFDKDNQLVYMSGHMMERMNGFLGNWILVNGDPDFILPVATRAYRLRLLNGSNSRIYKLAWTINGRTFRMEEVANYEKVRMDSLEVWEFINGGGGMGMMGMMNMPHPIHLHGKQFQVLERRGVTHNGYVDEGWKDTVLLMPGERIRLLVSFEDYPGLFLYHCHNLEHEDMGMMRNYLVENGDLL